MGRFENRKVCRLNTCPFCEHCLTLELDYDEPPYEEYFCMLDVSAEDWSVVVEDTDTGENWHRLTADDFSEKAREILKWKTPNVLPPDSERIVSDCTSCQYFNE